MKDTLRAKVECSGKEGMSFERAKRVSEKMRQREKSDRVQHYHCSTCKAWHVGSRPQAVRPRKPPRPRPEEDC